MFDSLGRVIPVSPELTSMANKIVAGFFAPLVEKALKQPVALIYDRRGRLVRWKP